MYHRAVAVEGILEREDSRLAAVDILAGNPADTTIISVIVLIDNAT